MSGFPPIEKRAEVPRHSLLSLTGKSVTFYPPPHNGRDIPCCVWESIIRPMVGRAASPGECPNVGQFLSFALPAPHIRVNKENKMIFFPLPPSNCPPTHYSLGENSSAGPIL